MGLFGNPRIVGDELRKCLSYYETELRVTAFQTREADLFNNTLVKYLDSIADDQASANEVCKAANRLVQAAHEIKRRHEEIKPVPNAALAMHSAWRVTFLSNTAWAEATLSAMEALANGMTPHYAYVQKLAGEYQVAWHKAQEEDKKFLRRLRVKAGEIEKIISRNIDTTEDDSWQPKPSEYNLSHVEKTQD